jgi:hypothetical protein
MKQIKDIFIYFFILAFIYIGAGIPLTSYCCQQKQKMSMPCCKKHCCCKAHECNKTTILKVDNYEQASNSTFIAPTFNLVAEFISLYSYKSSQTETCVNDDYGYPPGTDYPHHHLSLYCTFLI